MITVKEEFLTDDKTIRAIKLGGHSVITMWLAMKRYCAENSSDGFVPEDVIGSLPGAPQRWRKAVDALVECGRVGRDKKRGAGLVDRVEGGWELHDYLDHAQSKEEIELRREKARQKKRLQRQRLKEELDRMRSETEAMSPGDSPRDVQGDRNGDSPGTSPPVSYAGARALPSPAQPSPKKKDPPTPLPTKPRDRLTEQLTGTQLHQRVDVNELHEAYKRVFGLQHRTWHNRNLLEAEDLANAIDAHGLATCLLVVEEAPNDGMVSGRDDDHKAKHESIGYIFGNSAAFDRILKAARRRKPVEAKSVGEQVADLKKRKVS